jgi:hypothetical protein
MAVFQPELIELMKTVLKDATAMLPEAKRTSTMKAEIASHILACAAKGERNPTTLKIAALSAVVECTHYSRDISLRVPTKPAMHSNLKPAGYSDRKPATLGVNRMGRFDDVVEG